MDARVAVGAVSPFERAMKEPFGSGHNGQFVPHTRILAEDRAGGGRSLTAGGLTHTTPQTGLAHTHTHTHITHRREDETLDGLICSQFLWEWSGGHEYGYLREVIRRIR